MSRKLAALSLVFLLLVAVLVVTLTGQPSRMAIEDTASTTEEVATATTDSVTEPDAMTDPAPEEIAPEEIAEPEPVIVQPEIIVVEPTHAEEMVEEMAEEMAEAMPETMPEAVESAEPALTELTPQADERPDTQFFNRNTDTTASGEPSPVTQPKTRSLPTLSATDDYLVQRVFWGTDRKQEPDDDAGPTFGSGRAASLSLGTAQVTIPRTAHETGKIERPLSITLFRVKIPLQRERRDKHLTLYKRSLLSPSEFRAFSGEAAATAQDYPNTALVFIHGFNFGFDEALFRTAQIAHDLEFDGPTFLYSWPSQDRLASYVTDTDSADRAAPFMDEFLDHVFENPNIDRVHIIAHSMGNRALAGLLMRAGTRLSQRGKAFDQMILAAPDIDATVFASVAQHFTNAAENVTLYACGSDRALLASRKLRDDFPRAGDVPETGPVILPGIDTIDVTAPGTTLFSMNHNAYVESRSVLADLRLILSKRLHPPATRMPSLRERVLERGIYWLMPN